MKKKKRNHSAIINSLARDIRKLVAFLHNNFRLSEENIFSVTQNILTLSVKERVSDVDEETRDHVRNSVMRLVFGNTIRTKEEKRRLH